MMPQQMGERDPLSMSAGYKRWYLPEACAPLGPLTLGKAQDTPGSVIKCATNDRNARLDAVLPTVPRYFA